MGVSSFSEWRDALISKPFSSVLLFTCLIFSALAESPPAVWLTVFLPDSSEIRVERPVHGIETFLDSLTSVYADSGFLDANWAILEPLLAGDNGSPALTAKINRSALTRISEVHFDNLTATRPATLEREYFFQSDSGLSVSEIPEAEKRVTQTGLVTLQNLGTFQKINGHRGTRIVVYRANEVNSVQFDGILGAEQEPGVDTLRWVGSLHLDVPNIMGTGRRVQLSWERTRADAEKLQLGYTEPWIMGYPISGTLGLGREVVDGNYITHRLNLDLNWRVSSWNRLILAWEQTRNTLTYSGRLANVTWDDAQRQTLGLGFRLTPPDNLTNRILGVFALYHVELGRRTNAIQEMNLRVLSRIPLYKQLRYTGRMAFSMYQNGDASRDPSLLRPIGGARSVRGYYEDQYRGTTTVAIQNDLAIGVGKNSRVFIFNDYGWLQRPEGKLSMMGYGFGARVETNMGPIVFTLGKNDNLPWRNAMIHIQLAGIDRRWIEN